MDNRWKNRALWVSMAALLGMVANDAFSIAPEEWNQYVDAVLGILTAAGIITNPSLGKGYKDEY